MKKLIVLLAAIAMVAAFTASAMAEAELYGSARFRTYFTDNDNGLPGVESKKDLEWRIGNLTRFGVNFKSDKLTGKFELDARNNAFINGQDTTASVDETTGTSGLGGLRLRQLWGQYDFGTFKFMIGQNFPLYDMMVSNIAYFSGGLQPLGGMAYTVARTSQMRFTMGNLELAFLTPNTDQDGLSNAAYGFKQVNTTFPRTELRYNMKLENFALNFMGGWQTYEIESYDFATATGSKETETINSYVLGFRGKANFGPAYAGLGLTYRVNGKNYGAWTVVSKEAAVFEPGTHDVKDATAWGVVAALGWKINDMFTLEGGYGKLHSEQDTVADNEDDNQVWSLLAQIHVAPGVLIQPEFIYNDKEDVTTNGLSTDQGNETIVGVWWKIDFK